MAKKWPVPTHIQYIGEIVLNARLFFSFVLALCGISLLNAPDALAQHGRKSAPMPNFLKGDKIPAGYDNDWNLGPTGARGWIYTDGHETTDARQILVTKIDKGSPADGILKLKDVILGVGDSKFSYDPRTEFGKAIAAAEASKGKLELDVWRNGKSSKKTIKLKVLKSYSDTAPFDCPKSKRIFKQGCNALANQMSKRPNSNGIIRSLDTLALLSSGRKEFLPLIKKQVQWASKYSDVEGKSFNCWYYGPINLMLCEYTLATGDKTYLKDIRRITLEICAGQSRVGSWGHRFSNPDGRLGGYGMMNAPGLPMIMSLVLARKAGVTDPEVSEAIDKSTKLMRFYAGKGCVPYGDHEPWLKTHDDNGKNGIAALLFNSLGEKESAEYFSRMSVCSYGGERDHGHTGNYFNICWAMPAVALSGPHASGAWMKEYSWYYDLARRWDGTYVNQGQPIAKFDSFRNWSSTGAMLLAYGQPLRKLYLTGKVDDVVPHVSAAEAASLIQDGSGYSSHHKDKIYADKSEKELLTALSNWSPIVRERAAERLKKGKGNYLRQIAKLTKSDDIYSKLGACSYLGKIRDRAKPAVPTLRKFLKSDDLWLRIKAAQALAAAGPSGRVAIPDLLKLLSAEPTAEDPRNMQQRYLCFVLFDRGTGMLRRSLDGVDKKALYKGVRAGLQNEGGKARSMLASVYKQLTFEQIKPLLPAIYQATVEPAPSGIMFADGVRLSGMELMAKHKIKEGIPLCVELIGEGRWGLSKRVTPCLNALESYGGAAKSALPELQVFYKHLTTKSKRSDKDKEWIKRIEQLTKDIKSDKSPPKLRSISGLAA